MSQSKFTPANQSKILAGIRTGLSRAASAESAGLSPETVKTWVKKGRKDPESEYGDFAAAIDLAIAEQADTVPPPSGDPLPDEDELIRRLDAQSKKGNFPATKHLLEIRARRDNGGDEGEEITDPFEQLDGPTNIETARAKRAGKA